MYIPTKKSGMPIEFFDSLGLGVQAYPAVIGNFLQKLGRHGVPDYIRNEAPVQFGSETATCGLHCLVFLYSKACGKRMEDIMEYYRMALFSARHGTDCYIQDYIVKLYPIFSSDRELREVLRRLEPCLTAVGSCRKPRQN